jgi:hypothetical protein
MHSHKYAPPTITLLQLPSIGDKYAANEGSSPLRLMRYASWKDADTLAHCAGKASFVQFYRCFENIIYVITSYFLVASVYG